MGWHGSCHREDKLQGQSHCKTLRHAHPRLLSSRPHLCGHSWLKFISPPPPPATWGSRPQIDTGRRGREPHLGLSRRVFVAFDTFPDDFHQVQWGPLSHHKRPPCLRHLSAHSTCIPKAWKTLALAPRWLHQTQNDPHSIPDPSPPRASSSPPHS